jgi:flagellum-specific peptidoglycan hydrolase FlgJ
MKKSSLIIIGIVIAILSIGYLFGYFTKKESIVKEFTETEQIVMIQEVDTFSQTALVQMLKDLNVKYPYIVLAQSIVETGHWNSRIFYENHNLFGMKEARRRITTAEGTARNHAYYNHWRESVYDYAFYQCRYLGRIESEAAYFEYLAASYAEAPNYVGSLKATIKNENLKDLFDE